MINIRKLAFGFFGLVMVGSLGMVLFSTAPASLSTAYAGGFQIGALTDPLTLGSEIQGAHFAEEVLPLHKPALPFGYEFEGTVEQNQLEEGSAELLAEILAGESITGELHRGEQTLTFLNPYASLEPRASALGEIERTTGTQVHKEFLAEHRDSGSCSVY